MIREEYEELVYCGFIDEANVYVDQLEQIISEQERHIKELELDNKELAQRIKELEEYAKTERAAGYRQGADDVYLLLTTKQN